MATGSQPLEVRDVAAQWCYRAWRSLEDASQAERAMADDGMTAGPSPTSANIEGVADRQGLAGPWHCPICHAPVPDFDAVVRIDMWDAVELLALYAGRYDKVCCEPCGRELPARRGINLFLADSVLVVQARWWDQPVGSTNGIPTASKRAGAPVVHTYPTAAALSEAAWPHLAPNAEPLMPLEVLQTPEGRTGKLGDWADLSAETWASAVLHLARNLAPGGKHPDKLRDVPGVGDLGKLQGLTWQRLAFAAGRRVRDGSTMMTDLDHYIRPRAVMPETIPTFVSEFRRRLPILRDSRRDRYCAFAVAARACQAAAVENPFVRCWVEAFFSFEIFDIGDDRNGALSGRARVDAELAAQTIPEAISVEVCRETAHRFARTGGRAGNLAASAERKAQIVIGVLERIGQTHIAEKALGVRLRVEGVHGAKEIKRAVLEHGGSPEDLIQAAVAVARGGISAAGAIDPDELFRQQMAMIPSDDPVARARVEAGLGAQLNQARLPRPLLERIGSDPRPWEQQLPPLVRADLWTERSNALRLNGRHRDALNIATEVEHLVARLADPGRNRIAGLNVAILLRETGAPDAALTLLDRLVPLFPPTERAGALESLAVTHLQLGHYREAADAFAEARSMNSPAPIDDARLVAEEALARACIDDQEDRAIELLSRLPSIDPKNPLAVLAEMNAMTILASHDEQLRAEAFNALLVPVKLPAGVPTVAAGGAGRSNDDTIGSGGSALGRFDSGRMAALYATARSIPERIAAINAMVAVVISEAVSRGDETLAQAAMMAWTVMLDVCGSPLVVRVAERAIRRATDKAHPVLYLILARQAFAEGVSDTARAHLNRFLTAVASRYAAVAEREVAIVALGGFRRWFEQIAREIRNDYANLRALSEIRREALRHANPHSMPQLVSAWRYDNFSDEQLIRLAPPSGRLCVFDWTDFGGAGIQPMMTVIATDGTVNVVNARRPTMNIGMEAAGILRRLEAWTDCWGDVFARDEWRRLEDWVREELARVVESGDHVVFVEDSASAGLPWHIAAGRAFSVSYASSWRMIQETGPQLERPKGSSLGVFAVPYATDVQPIRDAFETTRAALQAMAGDIGMRFVARVGPEGDRQAGLDVLQASHVAVMLCHGIVEPTDRNTAFIVAEQGHLPSAQFVASSKLSGRRQRLGWRDIERLPQTAPIVITAACSSGLGHFAGLGERLGLFPSLNRGGTRSLVAPRWKSDARATGTILTDIARRHLVNGEALGRAVWAACGAAEDNGLSRRFAWNFALEGTWR